jgi:adenosylcobyric acid synthase
MTPDAVVLARSTEGIAVVGAGRGVAIVGTASGSGKSLHAIGLIKLATLRGIAVQPFKPAAVIDLGDPTSPHPDLWRRGVYHHCFAAGVAWHWRHNPVAVVPSADGRVGELYIRGEHRGLARLRGADHIDFEAMPSQLLAACQSAIEEALGELSSTGDLLVMEGAGSLDQHAESYDLANARPAAAANLPMVVVGRGAPDDLVRAVSSCVAALSPNTRRNVAGFMVNGASHLEAAMAVAARIRAESGLSFIGWTPPVRYPPYDGSPEAQQERYSILARQIAAGLHDRTDGWGLPDALVAAEVCDDLVHPA